MGLIKSVSKSLSAAKMKSPVGYLLITAHANGICSVEFLDEKEKVKSFLSDKRKNSDANEHLKKCIRQLEEYFAGTRTDFELSLSPSGTDFQKKVWKKLLDINFGETKSYKQLAIEVGDVKSIRAVGTANGANPIAIIVPCHRVIGSNNSLVGYGGGLQRKKWLLDFERKNSKVTQQIELEF